MTDIAPQVQAMLDREAIRDLAVRYAHLVWQNQPLATVDLFTADGSVDLGPDGGLIEGREALRAAYSHIVDGMVLHPFVHNHVVDLDSDLDSQLDARSASGIAYIDLRCIRDGKSLMGSGYYEDQYAKEDGVWKFRCRKITMHYLVVPGEGWDQPYGAAGTPSK